MENLKIPPVLQLIACAVLMRLLAGAPVAALQWQSAGVWAFLPAAAGLAVGAAGVAAFRQAQTTMNPVHLDKASRLVSSGVYRFTRNPMYLGLLLMLAAWALWLGHGLSWLGLPLFVAGMNRFQIRHEERVLAQKFGEDYLGYCRKVRRWV